MLERLTTWLAGDQAENLVPKYIGFSAPFPLWVCLFLIAGAGLVMFLYYRGRLTDLQGATRYAVLAIRTFVVMLALFLALGPAVVAHYYKPGEQFVVLLFDDSQSMRIGAKEGQSRGSNLLEKYAAAQDDFEERLKRKHQIARYRVGGTIEPLQEVESLAFRERESDLLGGVMSALTDLEGTKVSAVILFSDGVQQTSNPVIPAEALPNTVPVYTVGVDALSDWRDIEMTRLAVKRTDFDKSPVVVTAGVHSTGLAGKKARVEVFVGNRPVKSRSIDIVEDEEDHEVRLEFIPDRKGWIEYEVRVQLEDVETMAGSPEMEQPLEYDRIKENNVRRFIIDNRDKEYRILYVSARPNWENKYFRRALDDDDQLRLTSLIAISNADFKFEYRPGGKASLNNPLFEGFEEDADRPRYDEAVFIRINASENELVSGYPAEAEELFQYDLVIWGDVEREFFTTTQLELSRDFVEKRGGTLLILGGRNAFTEGNFAGTIIERMLPVVLYESAEDGTVRVEDNFNVAPTFEGSLTGSWALSPNKDENERLWEDMPELYGLNQFPLLRAGATVMAEAAGGADSATAGSPLFAIQRYGEGRCAILATGDTWQWQMQLDNSDDRHERLWRQTVRNLVKDTPEPVVLREKQDAYPLDTPATFQFLIRDREFNRREGLQTTVLVKNPSGEEESVPVDESIQEVGLYTVQFTPEQPGVHYATLTALDKHDEVVEKKEEAFLVEPDRREFQNAQYNPRFLNQVAHVTGGEMYSLDRLEDLAESIPLPAHMESEEVLLKIWSQPIFYFALVGLMALEWFLRRRRGYA